jgi:hypothetical protein
MPKMCYSYSIRKTGGSEEGEVKMEKPEMSENAMVFRSTSMAYYKALGELNTSTFGAYGSFDSFTGYGKKEEMLAGLAENLKFVQEREALIAKVTDLSQMLAEQIAVGFADEYNEFVQQMHKWQFESDMAQSIAVSK